MVIGPLLLAFIRIVLMRGVWESVSILMRSEHLLICIFLVYLLLLCNLLDEILEQLLHITVHLALVDESIARLVLGCCSGRVLLILTLVFIVKH